VSRLSESYLGTRRSDWLLLCGVAVGRLAF